MFPLKEKHCKANKNILFVPFQCFYIFFFFAQLQIPLEIIRPFRYNQHNSEVMILQFAPSCRLRKETCQTFTGSIHYIWTIFSWEVLELYENCLKFDRNHLKIFISGFILLATWEMVTLVCHVITAPNLNLKCVCLLFFPFIDNHRKKTEVIQSRIKKNGQTPLT